MTVADKINPTTRERLRVFMENSVDTMLGRREELLMSPSDKVGQVVQKYLEILNVTTNCDLLVKNGKGQILSKDWTLEEARILEDDVLFLEQDDTKVSSPWKGCWKPASLVIIFALCVLGCTSAVYMTKPKQPHVYTILLDAGSVHTSVFVYRYSEKQEGTAIIEQVLNCQIGNQVGITSFAGHSYELQNYLNSTCFRSAVDMIYEEKDIAAPIVTAGTAGMRTLRLDHPKEAAWIKGNLTLALESFADSREVEVKILSGTIEGLAGWVTANYLEGTLLQDIDSDDDLPAREVTSPTFGALDWGGASAQITMKVPISEAKFDVRLYGETHHLFTISHLCYGQKMSVFRHRAQMVYEKYLETGLIKKGISEPCAPRGSQVTQTLKDLFGTACTKLVDRQFMDRVKTMADSKVSFIGSGDIAKCKVYAAQAFDLDLCRQRFVQYTEETVCFDPSDILPPGPQPYFAFSTYWYLIDALKLPRTHTMAMLEEEIDEMCTTHRTTLVAAGIDEVVVDSACFKALYMVQLLTKGYHFNATSYEQIQFVKEVNGAEVGWTLGYTIMSSNNLPAITPTKYISDLVFGVCMISLLCCVLLCMCIIFTIQGKGKLNQHKQNSPFKQRQTTPPRNQEQRCLIDS